MSALVLALLVATGSRADDPVAVTSDSVAYCDQLARRLPPPRVEAAALPASSPDMPEIERLRAEGVSLCEAGHIRGGIIRLRRALMMVHAARPPHG